MCEWSCQTPSSNLSTAFIGLDLNSVPRTVLNILCSPSPGQPSPAVTLTFHSPTLFLCLYHALCLASVFVPSFLLDNSSSLGLNLGVFSGNPSPIPSILFRYLSSLLPWICVHILQHLSFPLKWFPLASLFSLRKHHCLTYLWPYYRSQCFLLNCSSKKKKYWILNCNQVFLLFCLGFFWGQECCFIGISSLGKAFV